MRNFLCFLGFLWSLPTSIIGFLLGLLLLLLKQIERVKWRSDFTIIWDLANNGWFWRDTFLSRGWVGFSLGCHIFVKDISITRECRTLRHETRHCYQQYALGVFFYPVYIIHSVWIWLFQNDKHSYYDNFLERDARRAAGQREEIPSYLWGQGPSDRWFFWIILVMWNLLDRIC